MTRLLLTGGAGTLGASVIDFMGDQYERIVVVDNFATGRRESLAPRANVEVVEATVEDETLMYSILEDLQPEHIIHAAASYRDPDDWFGDIRTNVLGTCSVVRAAQSFPPTRMIYLQTALCFGRGHSSPIPRFAATRPFTSYALSKTAGETYLLNSGLPVVSFRLGNVNSPRLSIGPIPTFYRRLKAGLSCFATQAQRDFLDISDLIDLLRLALRDDGPCGVFNASTGEATSILDVYTYVSDHLGVPEGEIDVRPAELDDVDFLVLDPSETVQEFDWNPKISAKDSIHNLLQWYDKNGVTDIYSHLKSNWGES